MAKFRNKVVVEAVQLLWSTWNEMCEFIGAPGGLKEGNPEGCYVDADGNVTDDSNGRIGLKIPMPDRPTDYHLGIEGDWIVRYPGGSLLPVSAADFERQFERIGDVGKYVQAAPSAAGLLVKYDVMLKMWPAKALSIYVKSLAEVPVSYVVSGHPESGIELYEALRRLHGRRSKIEYEVKFFDAMSKQMRAVGRIEMPDLLGTSVPVSEEMAATAACVRELDDAQLHQALRNMGCYLDGCDACAEVFFTGSKMHDHTCPKGR